MASKKSDERIRTCSVRRKALTASFVRVLFRWPIVSLIIALLVSPFAACGQDRAMQIASKPPQASPSSAQNSSPEIQPCSNNAQQPAVPVYTYEIVNTWPHDSKAFTQGLVFYHGWFYESAGRYGSSSLRKVEPVTGKIAKKVNLDSQYFAEGMTILKEKIYQLTWMEHKGFIYDLKNLRREGEFAVDGEGWGLADDEQSLVMSDGTNQLRFIDPSTFKVSRSVMVCDHGAPLMHLNELEFVKGEIFANIWKSDRIVRIDPHDGHITGWIDLTNLLPADQRANPEEDVLNGIAYDEKDDRLFVTGKRWPKIFEIRLKKTS